MILLDRSRWAAWHRCPRARYLEYEYAGTGIRLPQVALPLATGAALHEPLAALLRGGELEQVITAALANYAEAVVEGFQVGVQSHELTYVIAEQSALIEGLVRSFALDFLPMLREEFDILEVEQEHDLPIDCTCGLGVAVGRLEDHQARGCDGVLLMVRQDFVARRKSDGAVSVADFKSSAWGLDHGQNEHSVQMALGCAAAEKDLGEHAGHYYLIGLLKGKRDYPTRERTGLKVQFSPFCYGWYKAGDASFGIAEEWSTEYTSKKGFSKVPIWEVHFAGKPEGWSNVRWWVEHFLTPDKRRSQFDWFGPCQRPQHLEASWMRSAAAIEKEIAGRLALLDQAAHSREEWERVLDENFPQNWNACFPYGSEAGGCQFRRICLRDPGWEEPLAGGAYVRREPHHSREQERWSAALEVQR